MVLDSLHDWLSGWAWTLGFQFWLSCEHAWLYPTPNLSLSGLFLLSQWLLVIWHGREAVPQLGDCSFYFGCAGQVWPFPAINDCPCCHWPHTWAVLQDMPQSVPGAARFHYLFSHYASKQKSIISAALCPWAAGSTALGRFHRICLWTAAFNEDLLRIFEQRCI